MSDLRSRHRGWGWRLLARLCLFVTVSAFLAQSYATQSHFHHEPQHTGYSVAYAAGDAPAPEQLPFGKSPLTCPLCQAHVIAGAAFVPSLPALPVPRLQMKPPVTRLASVHISRTHHHNGQSRAPPSMTIT